jgi:hypothetical protein
MLQLDPPLPLWIPSRNQAALAHVIIDYGPEHDIVWGCFGADGEIWWLRNSEVRAQSNITLGREATPDL